MWALGLAAAALASAPTLTEPVRSGARSPDDAAVIIGIERYAFLPDVPHAERDLSAVADLLVYTRGVPPDRVQRLKGANREQILAAVQRAQESLGPDGTLWLYFAGHGAADPSSSRLLLVGDDAKPDPDVFVQRSVDVGALTASLPDGSVVILDTCWAGAARGGDPLVPDSRFAVPTWATDAPQGVTLWTASAPDQIAGAYHPARHGAFTYFVIGALRGWADGELTGEPDGVVELQEAQAWVERALAATGTRSQTPTLTGLTRRPLTEGRLQPGPTLDALPPNEPARLSALVGTLDLDTLRPQLPAVAAFHEAGYVAPISRTDTWQFEDGAGREVSFPLIYPLVPGTAEGDALHARLNRIQSGMAGGALLMSTGVLVAAVSPFSFGRYAKAQNKDLSCSRPDAIEYVCINDKAALGAGVATLSAGLVSFTVGMVHLKRKRKQLEKQMPAMVDAVNERLGQR